MTDLIDYMPRTDQFWEGNELPESLRCRPGRIDFDVLFFLWKDFMISVIGSLRSFSFFIISSAKTHWCGFLSATQACSTSSSILLLRWQNNESYNWARGQILLPSDRCKFWGLQFDQKSDFRTQKWQLLGSKFGDNFDKHFPNMTVQESQLFCVFFVTIFVY